MTTGKRQPKLTRAELRLLRFPPTKKTWLCTRERIARTESGDVKVKCEALNSGNQDICWMCGSLRPAKPKLLWPAYVRACEKAGIEPGQRYRATPPSETANRPKTVRRKGKA